MHVAGTVTVLCSVRIKPITLVQVLCGGMAPILSFVQAPEKIEFESMTYVVLLFSNKGQTLFELFVCFCAHVVLTNETFP